MDSAHSSCIPTTSTHDTNAIFPSPSGNSDDTTSHDGSPQDIGSSDSSDDHDTGSSDSSDDIDIDSSDSSDDHDNAP
jgi:hypothetical protein